jgi:hypothetical protein
MRFNFETQRVATEEGDQNVRTIEQRSRTSDAQHWRNILSLRGRELRKARASKLTAHFPRSGESNDQ